MKIKEVIESLQKYDPDWDFMITLPKGWYKSSDNRKEIWNQGGWTLDSVDFFLCPKEGGFVAITPISVRPEEIE